MQSSVIVFKNSASTVAQSPLRRLLTDALSLLAAYGLNFIACDLMYHDFNLQQSLKGSYWFVLGPVLWIFGPGLAWVEAWLKEIIHKEKNKISGAIGKLKGTLDPFDLFTEDALTNQRSNIDYLRQIGRITDL